MLARMVVMLRAWLRRMVVAQPAMAALRKARLHLRRRSLHRTLGGLYPPGERVFFLQVGSNDGLHGDPLNALIRSRREWSGIFVEPVPHLLERLRKNYDEESRFVFEGVAISDKVETRTFYYVSAQAREDLGDRVPEWYDQLGSFNPDHIGRHLDGLLEPYRVEVAVPCLPLCDVLKRHRVTQLDLIHIDTEGYDLEILKQVDFLRYRPKAILYENKHLTTEDAAAAAGLLSEEGYRLEVIGPDTLAVRTP